MAVCLLYNLMAALVLHANLLGSAPRRPLKNPNRKLACNTNNIANCQQKIQEQKILKFLNAFGQSVPQSGTKNIASGVFLKKVLENKKYSSAFFFLSDQKARGKEINQWAALRAAPPTRGLEPLYQTARTYFSKNY